MQFLVECWEGCGGEFLVQGPDRQDPRLTDGIKVACETCEKQYTFTVDGDGEPSLDSVEGGLGENIDGLKADESTHF